ncbi:hypothetical protein LZ32DRAFT_546454 [Colletotrichum eremochloae]|nr:hypothetical protein LZ32DRAFT_546454 [Colletotrichum eremochloae]
MIPTKEYSFSELNSEPESDIDSEERYMIPKSPIANFRFNLSEVACRFISFLVFITGVVMIILSLRWKPSDKYCAAQLGIWSPLVELIEYEELNWESDSVMADSGFSGPPTPELEARWMNISQVPAIIVPAEQLSSLNRSPEGFVPVSASSPSSGYIAGVEVFHHLHCLNALRQIVWQDSYSKDTLPEILVKAPELARKHADHCIGTLRQALMCNSDITPYLIRKTDDRSPGSPPIQEDFEAFHKCRKFPQILEWVYENGIPLSSLTALLSDQ